MSRYILIRRLRGPVILLFIGGLALFRQMGLIDRFWHLFWPLLMILVGLMLLAERFALSTEDGTLPYAGDPSAGGGYPGSPYPGSPYPGSNYAGGPASPAEPAAPSTSIVPAHSHDFDHDPNGGQS